MKSLAEMSDEELLAATRELEAAPDMKEIECSECGRIFEAPRREWNVKRCPACQKTFAYYTGKGSGSIHGDGRRNGDGLKNGFLKRR